MTMNDRARDIRRFNDERSVDALLTESGIQHDGELRNILLALRNLRTTEVPQPSPELAALMRPRQEGPSEAANVVVLEDWVRKHPRKTRIAFTTFAVAASLGIAGSAAAGNETLRRQAQEALSNIVQSFSAPRAPTPAPASPTEAPTQNPAVVPSPLDVPPALKFPAGPPPAQLASPEPLDHPAPTGDERRSPPGLPGVGSEQTPEAGTGTPPAVHGSEGKAADGPAAPQDAVPPRPAPPGADTAEPSEDGKVKGNVDHGGKGPALPRAPADPPQRGR